MRAAPQLPTQRNTRRAAFSLLELLLVVALIGLISSIVVVRTASGYQNAKFRRAMEIIGEADQSARRLATRRQRPLRLKIDLYDQQMRLYEQDARTALRSWRLPSGVKIKSAATRRENRATGEVAIQYDRQGASDSYAVQLASPKGDPVWLVVMGLTGQTAKLSSEADPKKVLDALSQNGLNAD